MTHTSDQKEAHLPDKYTITRLLVPGLPLELTKQLDEYRQAFEEKWGTVDLTRRYTSTLPLAEQKWLLENEPKRYWDGLPKFFQAFSRCRMEEAAKTGKLDDMPDGLLQIYLRGEMTIKGERGR